jgi:hypothetical protein
VVAEGIRRRVEQQAEGRARAVASGGRVRDHCREVAAAAVPANGDLSWLHADFHGVFRDVVEGGNRVVCRGRERILGGQPVFDRQNPHPPPWKNTSAGPGAVDPADTYSRKATPAGPATLCSTVVTLR